MLKSTTPFFLFIKSVRLGSSQARCASSKIATLSIGGVSTDIASSRK